MRKTPVVFGLIASGITLLTLLAGSSVRADSLIGKDAVVARVGTRVITVADVERRLANIPAFQLRPYGKTPAEIQRGVVEQVLVRELLLAQGAEAEHLLQSPEVGDRVRSVLRNAIIGQIRLDAAAESPVTDAEINTYYEANVARFNAPPRLALWRILVATPQQAKQIIETAKKDLAPKSWNELAREKSLDKVTAMRGGNLGFVAPDGTTADAAIRVDASLFRAGLTVNDGELVPEPVKEGDGYAVVWRRQSTRAVARTLEQEKPSIRQILLHDRIEKRIASLLEKIRQEEVKEVHPELVDLLTVSGTGEVQPVKRPGTLPGSRRGTTVLPVPQPGPGGLR
jgi:peptidyl-prolyl cis-trans isomerase C